MATATAGWQSHVVAVERTTTTTTTKRRLLSPGCRQTKERKREGERERDREKETARRRFERPAGANLDAKRGAASLTSSPPLPGRPTTTTTTKTMMSTTTATANARILLLAPPRRTGVRRALLVGRQDRTPRPLSPAPIPSPLFLGISHDALKLIPGSVLSSEIPDGGVSVSTSLSRSIRE